MFFCFVHYSQESQNLWSLGHGPLPCKCWRTVTIQHCDLMHSSMCHLQLVFGTLHAGF